MRFHYIGLLAIATAISAQTPCTEEDESHCLAEHASCRNNPTACCDGTGCFGYNFFKRCKKPPACLDEWNDCSSGMECCGSMVCAVTKYGSHECQEKTIKTVVADPPGKPTLAPTPTPSEEKNLETTKIPGEPVNTIVGCSTGDPHLYTFDGLAFDCQGEGEFILVKSTATQRQVQARFAHFADIFSENSAWSVTRGVAIQDEGDTPSVQINIPVLESSLAPNKVGPRSCPVQFFVDGIQRDLTEGSGQDDKVVISQVGQEIDVFYVESEMKVTVSFGYAIGCFINVCVHLPESDQTTIGLLGSANKNVFDDWTTRDNTPIPVPDSLMDRMQFAGYEFCTQNFCLKDASDSIFTYAEDGVTFQDLMHCDLPFGHTLEEVLLKTDPAILQECGRDWMCIVDSQIGGAEAARATRNARQAVKTTCNSVGGECNVADCCDGLLCVERNGLAKECATAEPTCLGEWSMNCQAKGCCGDLLCEELNGGDHQCRDAPECMPEWRSCAQVDCCEDMKCITRFDGFQQCRSLPVCMAEYDDCGPGIGVDCCGDLQCIPNKHQGGRLQCRNVPKCHHEEWRDCSEIPCCDGLTCVETPDDRHVCQVLPECVPKWNSCQYVGCCQDGAEPLKCLNFVDDQGRTASQCQAACASNYNPCSDQQPCCNQDYQCTGGTCQPKV